VVQHPSSELRARVLAAAAEMRVPSRHATLVRNAVLAALGASIPVAIFVLFYGLRLDRRPDDLVVATAGGAALVAGFACLLAFGRGRSMLGRRPSLLLALVIATPMILLLWKVGVTTLFPDMFGLHIERRGFRCLKLSCLLAPAPVAAVLLARRGSVPARPTLAGAAIGTAVGACIWVFVDLWCPVSYLPHLLLGHVLPVVLATACGAIAGARMLDLPGLGAQHRD
jgi:hypothetical protein